MAQQGIVGLVKLNALSGKYELQAHGKVIAKSKDPTYFDYHISRGDVPKIVEAGITSVVFDNHLPAPGNMTPTAAAVATAAARPEFTIDERFEMMDELITMTVVGKNNKAMIIGGKGGIGKSYAVQKVLERMGKVDAAKAISDAMEKARNEAIEMEDEEDDIEKKVNDLARIDTIGDYRTIKGYASAPALYGILYENKHRVIIFDDCDSILRNDDAVNVLKAALDNYDERWVSWNVNSVGGLPPTFKFEGQVIFVTNMDMEKVPEPIRTRCQKVDVAMAPAQRIERMRSVLADVMPEVGMAEKIESLDLIEQYMHVTKDINFRALMRTISIRIDPHTKNWKKLALFSLIEN